ncbi:transcriptional regulator, AraC family [Fibrisoma limi BUZ 3]|uniref:Transcriptional regulator, AraC family n=1 Tax=Fibrisoma limi BUZ 3 TaxID=1185876 RepID=I2GHH6_9BACT|nr:AraC family transcriptional regulator [Fibrisoma limi]CCH53351.1 transcriptional regulator, AraC family [Fibrisoma limi BUZ 3]
MTPNIPYFNTINEFLTAIQSRHRTVNDTLFCLRLEDTFPHTVDVMPPFRKGFYFISLITDPGATQIGYDTTQIGNLTAFLVFQAPGQIYSWHRDRTAKGYLIYFRKECFSFFRPDFDEEFPFFNILHTNFFPIRQDHYHTFAPLLDEVFAAYQRFPQPHQPPVAALKLLAVLYQFKTFVADLNQYEQRFVTPEQRLFRRYIQLINNYYLDKRTVEEYADLLNVTPHYLSESVKTITRQNALHFINQKLLHEAQVLLRYTPNDIAEVAYQLNFSDPANFGRFFKKHTQKTPLAYRREGT